MYEASKKAYKSLCRPILDVVWESATKSTVHDIELVQNSATRFMSNLAKRIDSVSD